MNKKWNGQRHTKREEEEESRDGTKANKKVNLCAKENKIDRWMDGWMDC